VIYIDDEGLIVRQTYRAAGPTGQASMDERFSDFRSVDGFKFPFRAVVRRGSIVVIEREVQEITLNAPIDPALFRRPS
jgi:hypothetical protein